MRLPLPDIGTLLLAISLLFAALIVVAETLERRRESRDRHRQLDEIQQEYLAYRELGYF